MKVKQINIKNIIPAVVLVFIATFGTAAQNELRHQDNIDCGADRTEAYIDLLEGKSIGLVCNQSSLIGDTHLIDTLLALGVRIEKIFSPEHGIRGQAEAGIKVTDEVDPVSGIPVISLYGNKRNQVNNS